MKTLKPTMSKIRFFFLFGTILFTLNANADFVITDTVHASSKDSLSRPQRLAQNNMLTSNIQLLNIKSPEANAFLQAAEIPVGKYTGTLQYSIPLYTVTCGKISLPISLDYLGTAIKVRQEATWVGLNWLLNAGGMITTKAVEYYSSENYTNMWKHALTGIPMHTIPISNPSETNLNYQVSGSHEMGTSGTLGQNIFENFIYSDADISHDLYNEMLINGAGEAQHMVANFAGKTLQYVYDHIEKEFFVVGKASNCKIEGLLFPTITDDEGNKYYFGKIEDVVAGESLPANTHAVRSKTMYLTKIESPAGHCIKIEYKNYGNIHLLNQVDEYIRKGYPKGSASSVEKIRSNDTSINNVYISKITSDDEIIEFSVSNRDDIDGDARKLDLISIYRNDASKSLLKQFKFNYSYFESNNTGGDMLQEYYTSRNITILGSYDTEKAKTKRLKLLSIQERVVENTGATKSMPAYEFQYYNDTLPRKTSAAMDYWGYYNGAENMIQNSTHTLLPRNYDNTDDCAWQYPDTCNIPRGDRRFDESFATIGMLAGVTLPTGGSFTFNYEAHTFSNYKYYDSKKYNDNVLGSFRLITSDQPNTVPSFATQEKEFMPLEETVMNLNISYYKPEKTYYWKNFINRPILLYHYKQKSTSSGIVWVVDHVDTFKPEMTDTVNATNSICVNTNIILPKGKYKIECPQFTPIVQTAEFHPLPLGINVYVSFKNIKRYKGAGLRIKSINRYDGTNNKKTSYDYNDENGQTSGLLMRPVKFAREKMLVYQGDNGYHNIVGSNCETYTICSAKMQYYWLFTSENQVPPYFYPVGYSKVTVTETVDTKTNGKIVYEYNNKAVINTITIFFKPLLDPMNGLLKKESVYDNNKLRQCTEYKYKVLDTSQRFINIVVEDIYYGTAYFGPPLHNYAVDACIYGRALIYRYPSSSFWIEPVEKKITEILDNGCSAVTTQTMTYNPANLRLKTLKTSTSRQDEYQLLHYRYPCDYTSSQFTKQLCEKNIIAVPVEIVSQIQKQGVTYTTDGMTMQYDTRGNTISEAKLDVNTPLSTFAFSNGTFLPDNRYRTVRTCKYSKADNPVEIKEHSSLYTSYIWSYNGRYPIAEIKGATYEQVKAALGYSDSQMTSLEQSSSPDVTNIRTKLLTINNALVTTYTYMPLVGMTKVVTPNGNVMTYNYDTWGRLKSVADNSGTIIRTFDYQYYK